MADFFRQPEWQQDVDRHSTLKDPVITVRPISRFDYTGRRPVMAIDHALVFATKDGAYDPYIPPHRPSRTDAATRRYVSVYEVDMGSHPVRAELELPSDDDAFPFTVTAELTWRVTDPEAYVRSGERDVPARLTRELQQLARPVSRRFSVEDSAAAEEAVQKTADSNGFAAGTGLAVDCVVRLRPDEDALEHRRRQRSLRYESEMLDPEHELQLRRARQQYELEALHQQQQQQLVAEKINFYRYHLQHGGVGAWALHLAQHPGDTQLVIHSIQQDQLVFIQNQLQLIGGDELEDYQKAEAIRQVRHAVDDLVRRRSTGADGRQALPAGTLPAQGGHEGREAPGPDDRQTPRAPAPHQPPGPAAPPPTDVPAPAAPPPPYAVDGPAPNTPGMPGTPPAEPA
ncbi:PE-PGRS family protein [Streptomyces sp. NPDC090994]|uniref:PE-PGRS family protein n=1 Tax=Streptomyces sp. NPDC090994 TaxID=3365969 RepID=UPI00381346D7